MGKALIKGTIFGGIILYAWMAISWMLIPWHCATLKNFKDENSVAAIVSANVTEQGIYVLPYLCGGGQNDAKQGPHMFASIRPQGVDFTSPKPYINAIIIYLVAAFFVTYLLLQARPTTYWKRVWFVTVFGIAAGILGSFPNWNWWGFSCDFTLVGFIDYVIALFLAGLAIAAVVPNRTE